MSFSLFCQEEPFNIEEFFEEEHENHNFVIKNSDSDEYLSSLLANEQKSYHLSSQNDSYLLSARKEAIFWIKSTSSRFGFSALTVILAVNYLDRCFLCSNGLRLQDDKPWMKQLSAVASLSLAAKVEETHVPFLLDLQMLNDDHNNAFVFEPKTIRRMELLILSTLNWRMNPVTAISFVQCILTKTEDDNYNGGEILNNCERMLLSVLEDWRWVQFSPATWASAAMIHVMGKELHEIQILFDMLQVPKERVGECYEVIMELIGGENKRKSCYFEASSPKEVINSCFSYESSSSLDSWAISSPELPPFKKPNCSNV